MTTVAKLETGMPMSTLRAQRSSGRRHRRSESGAALVLATVFLVVLLAAASLSFDISNMINVRQELGHAVDAGALAGAQALTAASPSASSVRKAAQDLAAANPLPSLDKNKGGNGVNLKPNSSNAAGGDIVLGTYDFTAATFTLAPTPVDISTVNAVQVNARLSQAARALPLAFAPVLGATSFDTVRTATSVIGATSKQKSTAPVAVNRDVFTGKAKGFLPPDDLYLSTKNLTDMAWTGFFGPTNASAVKSFETDPSTIPQLKVGDVINITNANQTADYHAMKADYPPGTLILIPVCIFDPGISRGTVVGFTTLRVDYVQDTADPKYIDTTVVPNKTGSTDPNTIAECFGTDCRSFLVN